MVGEWWVSGWAADPVVVVELDSIYRGYLGQESLISSSVIPDV